MSKYLLFIKKFEKVGINISNIYPTKRASNTINDESFKKITTYTKEPKFIKSVSEEC